jgi:hypothetical protein
MMELQNPSVPMVWGRDNVVRLRDGRRRPAPVAIQEFVSRLRVRITSAARHWWQHVR